MTFLSLWNWLKPLQRLAVVCRHRPRRRDRPLPARIVPRLEVLEDRTVPSTLTVTSAADNFSAGTLRVVLAAANSGDTINFAPSLAGQTISLTQGELAINKSLDIEGLGASQLTVSGGDGSRVFDILASNASVTIAGLTISDGLSSYGSGITNYGTLTVNDCTLSGNVANEGGAPNNLDGGGAIENFGNLTINNSTISGNRAAGWSGIAYSVSGGGVGAYPPGNGYGGGIYAYGGTLSINSSTIADNEAAGGTSNALSYGGNGFGPGNGYGGGLYIAGGTVTINNSTLAGNQAVGGLNFYYVSTGSGGGVYNIAGPSALQMHDTLLADNTAVTDASGNTAVTDADLDGGVTSQGHNLIGNTTGGSGFVASDLLNVNPQLGPLQDNGGPTATMALLPGSPAINAGDNTNAPAYDQRGPGFARIVGGPIDIGAFEVQNLSGLTVSGFPAIITAGATIGNSFTVTARNADGTTDTGYTGTIDLSSTDPTATFANAATGTPLSGDSYTFQPGDHGTHTFTAVLTKAGTQSITATDSTNAVLTDSEGNILVEAAAANTMSLSGFPSSLTAGTQGTFTVTAYDAYGNVATSFADTVHFTTSAAKFVLPADTTLTNGTGQFSATLFSAGTQSITVTDSTTPTLTATEGGITVTPAAASKFILAAPASVTAGQSFSLTVTVEDPYGNVVVGYAGTVHFSSTDPRAKLPKNYPFTASDKGVHTFTGLVLHTKGKQTLTVTDTHISSLTGSVIVEVLSATKP
ncbi:MAG TPA: choice-of-anchor Q domain-containing protein [Gemmataceae bacterium]|jgi:hypothetical protein